MLYPVFTISIAALQACAQSINDAGLGTGQRTWMSYPGFDPTSITDTVAALDRSAIAEGYADALTSGGSPGSVMADKIQSDYVAAQERAMHLQQSGPIRCRLHAAARRAAHANPAGGVLARVSSYVQDLIVAGEGS